MTKTTPTTTTDSSAKLLKRRKPKETNSSSSNNSAWLSKEKRKVLLDKLLGEFLTLHKEAMESVKVDVTDPLKRVEALTRLSQALDRTLNALIKATPQTGNLNIAQDVLKHQVAFVEANFPQHAEALLSILEPFGVDLIKIYSE
ncbi:MAG: DUF1804 family protein [Magnetococcales bacterium]|nr:DUF1804 family protein [Magnetococcales bacterium]